MSHTPSATRSRHRAAAGKPLQSVMKHCAHCGTENDPAANVCQQCGTADFKETAEVPKWLTFQVRLPAWADWFALTGMALTAPAIAQCIHSVCVFLRGYRPYNAEIGGAFFHHGSGIDDQSGTAILRFLGGCGLAAIPTLLALLPFRRQTRYRWLVWTGFIAIWTWALFSLEVAVK